MGAPVQRRRVFAWSAVFGYSGLAFTLTRNVLLVPLYLHYIDLGEYGAWLATGGALAQLLVSDYGLTGVVTQRIAALTGRGDLPAIRGLVAAGLANALLLALGLSALSSLIAVWLPATQGLESGEVSRVFGCFLIAVAANAFGVVSAAALAAVRGAQRPVAAGLVALLADILSVLATLVLLAKGYGLYAVATGLLVRSVLTAIGALIALAPLFAAAPGSWWPRRQDSLALWRDSARFFVTSIAMRLQSQANVLFVGVVLGPHAAAIYGLTVRAHETVYIVMGQLYSAFGPVLAHLAGSGNVERLHAVIRRLLPLVAALAAVGAACVVALNHSFMTLWVGADTFGGWPLTVLMAIAMWITSLAYVGYETLLARGEFQFIARTFALGSVVHVVVLLAVLQFLGAWAGPLALCASSVCWGTLVWRRVAADMALAKRETQGLIKESLLIGLVAALAATGLALSLPEATTWPVLALESAASALAIAAILLLLRPALRVALSAEIISTLRALRPA